MAHTDATVWRIAPPQVPSPTDIEPSLLRPFSYLLPLLTTDETTTFFEMLNMMLPTLITACTDVSTICRLAPILAMKGPLHHNFARLQQDLDWGPRTAATYWAHLLKLKAYADLPISTVDTDFTRQLRSEAAQAPIWDLEDGSQFLPQEKVDLLSTLSLFLPARHVFQAGNLCLATGQRLSDVLLLRPEQVWRVTGQQGTTRVSLRVVEGKTVGSRGAYTISLPDVPLAQVVCQATREATTRNSATLFDTNAELLTRGLNIDVRALRRTGLSRLAMSGTPLETLISLSRHATTRMLELYLASGLFNEQTAQAQMTAIKAALSAPVPRATRCCDEL